MPTLRWHIFAKIHPKMFSILYFEVSTFIRCNCANLIVFIYAAKKPAKVFDQLYFNRVKFTRISTFAMYDDHFVAFGIGGMGKENVHRSWDSFENVELLVLL